MNWITAMFEAILAVLQPKQAPTVPPKPPIAPEAPPTPTPTPPTPLQGKYLWDNPKNVRHSLRVMCDEAGLSVGAKNVITACIYQESRFNPKAIGPTNSNGTTDYGLCQFNNGKLHGKPLWIGPGAAFATKEEVLNDPEKNVRIMIKEYKLGYIWYWSSYKTGAYKKWLGKV